MRRVLVGGLVGVLVGAVPTLLIRRTLHQRGLALLTNDPGGALLRFVGGDSPAQAAFRRERAAGYIAGFVWPLLGAAVGSQIA